MKLLNIGASIVFLLIYFFLIFWLLPHFLADLAIDFSIREEGIPAKYQLLIQSFLLYFLGFLVLFVFRPGEAFKTSSLIALILLSGFIVSFIAAFLAGANFWYFLAFLVYFAPSTIAENRKHHNYLAILFTNLFLGWTIIGWVVALIWSGTSVHEKRVD